MTDYTETPEIDTRSLMSGWEAVIKHGDGTASKVWGPTEERALEKAHDVIAQDRPGGDS